jgi:hypothetical protein
VRLPSGLWVTTPLRTLVRCASLLTFHALVCAADAALRTRHVDAEGLAAAAERRRGQRGAVVLRRPAGSADGRAESPAESLTRLLVLPALPAFEPQVELFDHAARLLARFDLADRAVRMAVEAAGKAGHAGELMVAKDRRRDRRTEALGWHTERVNLVRLAPPTGRGRATSRRRARQAYSGTQRLTTARTWSVGAGPADESPLELTSCTTATSRCTHHPLPMITSNTRGELDVILGLAGALGGTPASRT